MTEGMVSMEGMETPPHHSKRSRLKGWVRGEYARAPHLDQLHNRACDHRTIMPRIALFQHAGNSHSRKIKLSQLNISTTHYNQTHLGGNRNEGGDSI